MYIGVICVAPEFDFFFKIRKPKYKRGKEVIVQDRNIMELESSLRFDLKLSYSKFSDANRVDALRILAGEIINAVTALDTHRIKDFNKSAFQQDLYNYFVQYRFLDSI